MPLKLRADGSRVVEQREDVGVRQQTAKGVQYFLPAAPAQQPVMYDSGPHSLQSIASYLSATRCARGIYTAVVLLQPSLTQGYHLVGDAAEAAFAAAEFAHCGGQIVGAEIGPHRAAEDQLRVGGLPEQKVAQ